MFNGGFGLHWVKKLDHALCALGVLLKGSPWWRGLRGCFTLGSANIKWSLRPFFGEVPCCPRATNNRGEWFRNADCIITLSFLCLARSAAIFRGLLYFLLPLVRQL